MILLKLIASNTNIYSNGLKFVNINRQLLQINKLNKIKLKWLKDHLQLKEARIMKCSRKFLSFSLAATLQFFGKNLFVHVICDAQKDELLASSTIHDRLEGALSESAEPDFNWEHFWSLLKPQFLNFLAAVLCALIVSLINTEIPRMLGDIVNILSNYSEQTESSTFIHEVKQPVYKIFKAYLYQSAFTFFYISFLTRMGERIASNLREELFVSLLHQDIAFYDKHKAGELVNRLTADVQDFKSSFKMCISQGMRSVTQIIGCGISMYHISPHMSLLTAIVVPSIIVVGGGLGSVLRSVSKAAQQQVGLSTAVADECLGNMRTVRAFAMEDHEHRIFAREVEKSRHLNEILGMGIGVFQAGANMLLNGVVLGTLYVGGYMISTGQIKPGDLMAFLVSAQTIQKSLAQLSILWGTYVRGISAGARVFEYLETSSLIPLRGGFTIPENEVKGSVTFEGVSFTYPSRSNHEVLSDFNLEIPKNKIVAIVGESGGGKSTLAQLLERFYDVTGGSIKVDGHDIRTFDPSWLRGKLIGFINQEPVLFATSLMENIRYGKPSASDEEVISAAKTANAHNFISKFPHGYHTIVGERGVTISGGQKQRIAIARALLKNPKILVLDEATSALDAESERVVQEALDLNMRGRTTIIIAHRLSTVRNAHLIAVVDNGRVAELGTHESLKNQDGIYAKLIKQQQK